MKAAALKRTDNETFFFDAATLYSQAKNSTKALAAMAAVVEAGLSDVPKVINNPLLETLKALPEWKGRIRKMESNQQSCLRALKAPKLREELLSMWANDQQARLLLEQKRSQLKADYSSPALAPEFKRIRETDAYNIRRIKEIVRLEGWPTIPAVGRDGAYAAWAIVQHSNDVKFQEKCLRAMKKARARKEISAVDYAELYDRIRRNKYEKQFYGMAIRRRQSGNDFYPIENEGRVNRRRKQIGLEPIAVYARLNGFIYRPLSEKESKRRDDTQKAAAEELVNRSKQAFTAGDYKQAKTLFDEALSRFGDVSPREIYLAAVRFAGVEKEPETYRATAFSYLTILLNKGWKKKSRLLEAAAFKNLHSDPRWKELLDKF